MRFSEGGMRMERIRKENVRGTRENASDGLRWSQRGLTETVWTCPEAGQ